MKASSEDGDSESPVMGLDPDSQDPSSPPESPPENPPENPPEQQCDPNSQDGFPPLTTEAGLVMVAAQREMDKLGQRALTSMHLMLGLCAVGVEPLRSILRERAGAEGSEIERQLCEQLRRRARELKTPNRQGIAISVGFSQTLILAAQRVNRLERDHLDASDLLAGLLQWRDAQAVKELIRCGIDPGLVLSRLPKAPAMDWRRWSFEPAMEELMCSAENCAREAHLPFLGTPHLLIALIRTGQPLTISLLRRHRLPLDVLCRVLEKGVGRGRASSRSAEPLWLRRRSRRILVSAAQRASDGNRTAIAEADLLAALLQEQEGFTAEVLRRAGAAPETLLRSLTDD